MSDNGKPKQIKTTADLTPDPANANLGTERGLRMLDDSLREDGAGRSILADKDGMVVAGNKTLERAADLGLPIRVVQTDGRELVVVQRTDLDLDGEGDAQVRARRMAYRDNRSSQVGLDWNVDQLVKDAEASFDFSAMFEDWELDQVIGYANKVFDPEAEWEGMPEYQSEDLTATYAIKVHLKTRNDLIAFAKLVGQKLTEKTRAIWYPKVERLKFSDKEYVNKS